MPRMQMSAPVRRNKTVHLQQFLGGTVAQRHRYSLNPPTWEQIETYATNPTSPNYDPSLGSGAAATMTGVNLDKQ